MRCGSSSERKRKEVLCVCVCVCLSLSLCLCVCVCVCVCVCLCLSVFLSAFLSVCLSVCPWEEMRAWVILWVGAQVHHSKRLVAIPCRQVAGNLSRCQTNTNAWEGGGANSILLQWNNQSRAILSSLSQIPPPWHLLPTQTHKQAKQTRLPPCQCCRARRVDVQVLV